MLKFPGNFRTLLVFCHDVAASALAWSLAYWWRFSLDGQLYYQGDMWRTLVWVVPVQTLIFWRFGLYRGIWRFASLPDLKRILLAVAIAVMVAPLVLYMVRVQAIVPRSVLILDPLLLIMIMGGSRFAYRVWKEYRTYGALHVQGKPIFVLGAGDAATALLKELARSEEWRVAGVLDDNVGKHGRLLHGVKVLGRLDELSTWAARLDAKHAIIAMHGVSMETRRRAIDLCAAAGVSLLTVPSYGDLVSGKIAVSQVHKVELDDLLGRDPVQLDDAGLHALLTGKVVMVTGAGGSIGAELCRQIAGFGPKLLVMLEQSEYALYQVEQEFQQRHPELSMVCLIGDVKNRLRLDQILQRYRPSVIFHAAAYKHVPLMEENNAWEVMQNNVLGTYVLAQAAIASHVEKFVLISTDKAVNPTNMMGASKRVAEMVCQGLQGSNGTRFVMVRFGNVLGSTGSVIPKFQEQIAKGGPITVTHPEITRYFMSIPESAQLVLQAGLMGQGGEIFVMDMGEPVRIADLAKDMIKLSGFTEQDIRIVFTGLRPGEKLYEELLAHDEHTLATPHPKLRIAQARQVDVVCVQKIAAWLDQERTLEDVEVRRDVHTWVPEYNESLPT